MLKRISLIFILSFCCAVFSYGQDDDSSTASGKLEELRQSISDVETRASDLKEEILVLQTDLKKINDSIKIISNRESKLKKDLEKINSSKVEIERLISDLKGRLLEIEKRAMDRIRALYTSPRKNHSVINVSATVSDPSTISIGRSSVYATKIKKFDARELEDITLLRGKRSEETSKLEVLMDQQTSLLAESALQRKELETRKNSAQKIANELIGKRKKLEEQALALRSQELRFETILRGLTGGSEQANDGKESSFAKNKVTQITTYKGDGFPKKQLLKLNFGDQVLVKFGKKADSNSLPSKGIKIELAEGTSVSLPISGKVGFVGQMPQLGTVVILDHGNRDYTLLGGLKSASVTKSQVVEEAQTVGQSEKVLYLETRREGKAVDPLLLYKTR